MKKYLERKRGAMTKLVAQDLHQVSYTGGRSQFSRDIGSVVPSGRRQNLTTVTQDQLSYRGKKKYC